MEREEEKMKSFMYTIIDPLGIHARPAGQIVNEAKNIVVPLRLMPEKRKLMRQDLWRLWLWV